MATLKFRNPLTGQFESLAFIAKGDKGDKGDKGEAGSVGPLNDLTDVTAPANTPSGKILGTTAEGAWGAVDPPVGDVTEAPIDGNQYVRQDAGWSLISLTGYLQLSGGTLTGPLILDGAAPATNQTATDKAYVDSRIWTGTQAQYDAIPVKDPEVLYVVVASGI